MYHALLFGLLLSLSSNLFSQTADSWMDRLLKQTVTQSVFEKEFHARTLSHHRTSSSDNDWVVIPSQTVTIKQTDASERPSWRVDLSGIHRRGLPGNAAIVSQQAVNFVFEVTIIVSEDAPPIADLSLQSQTTENGPVSPPIPNSIFREIEDRFGDRLQRNLQDIGLKIGGHE